MEKEQEIEMLSKQAPAAGSKGGAVDDWSDWGAGNTSNGSQEMEDLRFQVECLESDLRKKDSLIKAVEAKMKEVSKKSSKVDVSKFSAWCDGVVGEKVCFCYFSAK